MSGKSPSTREYAVVINDEEQWSVWPAHRPVPAGWTAEGTVGSRAQCVEHIEASWTDIRPRSVRETSGDRS